MIQRRDPIGSNTTAQWRFDSIHWQDAQSVGFDTTATFMAVIFDTARGIRRRHNGVMNMATILRRDEYGDDTTVRRIGQQQDDTMNMATIQQRDEY